MHNCHRKTHTGTDLRPITTAPTERETLHFVILGQRDAAAGLARVGPSRQFGIVHGSRKIGLHVLLGRGILGEEHIIYRSRDAGIGWRSV